MLILTLFIGFWIGGRDDHVIYFPGVGPLPSPLPPGPTQPNNGYLGGQWTWSNGNPWTFVAWAEGEPKNQGDDDCVMIRADTFEWEDFSCSTRLKVY